MRVDLRVLTAGTAALAVLLAPGAHAAGKAASGSFEGRLASKDIVYSHRAMDGARVALVADPSAHAAGESLVVLAGGHAQALQVLVTVNSLAQQLGLQDEVEEAFSGGGSDKAKIAALAEKLSGTQLGEMVAEATGISMTAEDLAWAIAPADEVPTGQKIGQIKGAELAAQELIKNNRFTEGPDGLAHWEHDGKAFTTEGFGPIRAPDGSKFAVIHTGLGDPNNRGFLQQGVTVSGSRNGTFSAMYNFVTAEYPDWVGTQFNDYMKITIEGPSGEKTFSLANYLNSSSFQPVSGLPGINWDTITWGEYLNWIFNGVAPQGALLDHSTGGQTGWLTFTQKNLALKSGIYKVRFEVGDVGDNIFDSAGLIAPGVSLK